MITSRIARRALLAATITATTALPHQAFADGPSRSSSANPSGKPTRAASHEPGSVNSELQRLFNESGQEMPSMRSQDLPNGRNMQSHLVRPKNTAPPKQNAFQKFFGKITGRSKTTPAPASEPPVPPAMKEPAAVPPAGHSLADDRRTQPTTQPQKNGVLGRLVGNRPGTPNAQTTPLTTIQPPVPPSPRTSTAGISTPAKPAPLPATIPLPLNAPAEQFKQPGAAPAFMNSASAAAARAAAATKSAAAAIPDDPMDALDLDDASDVLDLDAVAQQAKQAMPAAVAPLQAPAAAPLPAAPFLPDTVGKTDDFTPDSTPQQPSSENPFTGVGLDDTEADDAELPGPPVPAVREFDPALPAFSPDSVPSGETASTENSVSAPSEPLQTVDAERMRIAAEQAERRRQLERIQSRHDLTGFKGFCPVALRDQRQLVDAQPQIQSTFGLHTWTFSSDEARLAFEAEPQRYAPAAGGDDVVILATRQEQVPGKLDFALWYRGRLHLFSSRETMASFLEDPQQFAVTEVE